MTAKASAGKAIVQICWLHDLRRKVSTQQTWLLWLRWFLRRRHLECEFSTGAAQRPVSKNHLGACRQPALSPSHSQLPQKPVLSVWSTWI